MHAHSMRPWTERFWEKVDRSGGPNSCWEWTAGRFQSGGYGQFNFEGKPVRAHRLAYELMVGPIPAGMDMCHRCDNPPCVNPSHLFLGTASDNTLDAVRKGRLIPRFVTHPGNPDPPRGEAHMRAKLTDNAVRDVRRRHATGVTMTALAREYGVDQGTIRAVVRVRTWRHVV